MAFKRSAVRSRLSPPQNTAFLIEMRCFSNFLTYFVFLGQQLGQQILPYYAVVSRRKVASMATIQEKIKGKKIVSFKIKACVGRDEKGKQVFRCKTWYPPEGLTNGKARKEVQKVAIL